MTNNDIAKTISMKWIMQRCEEEGDCLLWKLGTNGVGHPRFTFRIGGECANRQLRRVVWALVGGRELQGKQVLTTTCGNPGCLNPAHLKVTTRAAVVKKMMSNPDVIRRVTVANAVRGRQSGKITMEQALLIRESTQPLSAIAQEYGISIARASKVRRNEAWRDLRASPFAGLGG